MLIFLMTKIKLMIVTTYTKLQIHTLFHDSDMCDILSLLGNCLISSVFSISFEKSE